MKNYCGRSMIRSMFLLGMHVLAICGIAVLMIMGNAMGEVSRVGLVAEWHFDGNAKDSSGNGNDGIIYGGTFADGIIGRALSLNGGNDYTDFGEGNGKLDFGTSPFSIEFWINYQGSTIHPYVQDIVGKTQGKWETPGYFTWAGCCWGHVNDSSYYTVSIVTSTATWGTGSGGSISKFYPNKWVHVVYVREGNTYTIYGNGLKSYSETKEGIGLNVDNNVNFKIGDSTDADNFKGLIDEVRIYNRALSADEVKANYEAGQIIITSSPSGAEVLINGQSKGIASPTLTVSGISPGTYAVKCKLAGYLDYNANVILTASSSASINCQLNLEPTPTLTATPNPTSTPTPTSTSTLNLTSTQVLSLIPDPISFNFGTMNSGESSSQSILISNAGSGTLTWNIIDDQPWITLYPTTGTNSGTVEVKINTVGLSPGSYNGNIILTSNSGTKKGTISFKIVPASTSIQIPTLTIANTVTTPPPLPLSEPIRWVDIIIVVLAIAIIAALFLLWKKIRKPKKKLSKCPKCGAIAQEDSSFCEVCGTTL